MVRSSLLFRLAAGAAAVTVAALMTGCATPTQVSPQAASYGSWPSDRAPGSYTFERLPSQQAQAESQDKIEAAAAAALERAGFKRAASIESADVLVQAAARLTTVEWEPAVDPWVWHSQLHFRLYAGYGPSRYHPWGPWGYWGSPFWVDPPRAQQLEVALVLRDRKTQQPIHEARAKYDRPWNDSTLIEALFDAALAGFPQAAKARTVTVPLPAAAKPSTAK
jgi:hypothetical protein